MYEKVSDERKLRQILVKVPHDATRRADKAARAKANALTEKLKKGAKASGKDGVSSPSWRKQLLGRCRQQGARRGSRLARRTAHEPAGSKRRTSLERQSGAIVGPSRGTTATSSARSRGSARDTSRSRQAKLELAEQKFRQSGRRHAKAAAEAALAKAKETPTAGLKTIFPPPSDTQEASAAPPTPPPPRVEETGLFSLRARPKAAIVEGIGVSSALAKAAFALTNESPLAGPFDDGRHLLSFGSRNARIRTWPTSTSGSSSWRARPR